ncbi:GDSL-type esterase/lipase family protein [Streptantibioticus rubrisoli]|uniref:GDSL-type esterase/lipase family protein n=1 Tax=Streptantibioticus rubrisoli TaxID=1387313 RepID=A0ABT1P820_9ACTN|nr:GDSL-type esterase/lipase family protein [Streptantibioticus rubrisoli]MCQ4041527.1 GDSL-type esterase/lipase family protein [Streptantibioticus rubrisoli]
MGRAGVRAGAVSAAIVALLLPLASGGAAQPTAQPTAARAAAFAHCPAVPPPPRVPAGGSTVVVGASIAAGYHTSGGERTAWPRLLAARLRHDHVPVAIVNDSVSAARLLTDSPGHPCTSALHREGPALAVPGVRTLVLVDLINDIQQTPHVYDPRKIEAGLSRFVASAHAHHVRVVAGTIAPYGGFPAYQPAGERTRRAVNAFILRSRLFDGVLDFDAVVRDPSQPDRMRPDYDSGDHLHPDDAGQRAMARAVPVGVIWSRAGR